MHPRNVFNTAPDYTDLAIRYSDFRKYCCLGLNGKVFINYGDQAALIALTKVLLLEYFQLDVEFAPGSLIPTVPLRLNYILWLEDILAKTKTTGRSIRGIDIGCGSSCIYSLLGARKNNWCMLALETNAINREFAQRNITANHLEGLITVFATTTNTGIFQEYFNSENENSCDTASHEAHAVETYDFCMCNPPFYDIGSKSLPNRRKSQKRPPPPNCSTGYLDEVECVGGECKFVTLIIEESLKFKNKIRIFTSMLGHKNSLPKIENVLKCKSIANYCSTEFIQGNTTRWAIAWSFQPDVVLKA